jgi:hypothetical protein
MVKWVNTTVHENGLNYIRTAATVLRLVRTFTANDSFATVTGQTLATATMATADYAFSGAQGAARVLTTTGKTSTATATATAGTDLHVCFTSGSEVIWATDETTNQQIATGNVIVFPAVTYTMNQPT